MNEAGVQGAFGDPPKTSKNVGNPRQEDIYKEKSIGFEPKKKIISAGTLVEDGYLIVSGSLVGVEGEQIYRFGPGAVLGLAEGIINRPSKISVVTTTAVQARLTPFHKADTIISLLPKEMQGILQTIIKRTLAVS